ncbi:Brefeldin A-inhibited guanine nucleotide-exchange protein 2 [Galdieria sulphuraria]|nr:Brefeldin A-inhibited guanine nucleotide-exchange protein 2 [Galdieria sulphuraria]
MVEKSEENVEPTSSSELRLTEPEEESVTPLNTEGQEMATNQEDSSNFEEDPHEHWHNNLEMEEVEGRENNAGLPSEESTEARAALENDTDGSEENVSTSELADEGITVTQQQDPSLSSNAEAETHQTNEHGSYGENSKIQPLAKLIEQSLLKITKLASSRKYRKLRNVCKEAVEIVKADASDIGNEKVFEALLLGCDSGKTQVVVVSLDTLQKLIAYGWIQAKAFRDKKETRVVDDVVKSVCDCFQMKDDSIFLRMTQILLNIVSGLSPEVGIHEGILVFNVRTLYNIHLSARSSSVRTISRAALTQVLDTVFSRMEKTVAEGNRPASSSENGNDDVVESRLSFKVPGVESEDLKEDTSLDTEPLQKSDRASYIRSIEEPEYGSEKVETSSVTTNENNGVSSKIWETQTQKERVKSVTENVVTESVTESSSETFHYEVLERDAYLLFRALCKLSSREQKLIKEIIETSGPAFRSSPRFVYAVRNFLIPSLLTNCVAPTMAIMELALSIVELLLYKLRSCLKWEISAIFHTVIFRYLESATSTHAQTKRALLLVNKLVNDPQLLADLFLNYDCDINSNNVYERIVSDLSRIIQKNASLSANSVFEGGVGLSQPSEGQHAAQEVELRQLALTGISYLLSSLKEWSKPLISSQRVQQNSNLTEGSFPNSSVTEIVQGIQTGHSDNVLNETEDGSREEHLDTSVVEKRLQIKREVDEAIRFFNFDADQGIDYLCKVGYLRRDPKEIAKFLLKTEGLDATMVGQYLGDGNEFHMEVMHEFVDLHDFVDLKFDEAIRLFLSNFRLPGEAQKIDRIMEKFASRYCACNPELFANADTAYVLAYAVIMLNTDAHHPQVKHKMSKEEFIKNNRGINDGEDLPEEFLGELYDRIVNEEIRLGDFVKDSSSSKYTSSNKLHDSFRESERLMKYTKQLFSSRDKIKNENPNNGIDYTYYSATNPFHGKLMFEVSWCAILAAISVLLERAGSHDTDVVGLCTQCFRDALVIASIYGMDTERNALASSLAKFTHLSGISDMKIKNIECIRAILQVAISDGDFLGDTWMHILKAISQLEEIRAIAAGDPERYHVSDAKSNRIEEQISAAIQMLEKGGSAVGISSESILFQVPDKETKEKESSDHSRKSLRQSGRSNVHHNDSNGNVSKSVDPNLSLVASTIKDDEIQRVFSNSVELSSTGIADFCKALSYIAWEEIAEAKTPSFYMLLKAVEVAHYNMQARIRVEWKQVWDHLEPLFSKSGCHPKQAIAMFAIDALRQLSLEFLEREELSQYAFQRSFLKPFQLIFAKTVSANLKELILSCLAQIVCQRYNRLRSGWKSIFQILSQAAEDKTTKWNVHSTSDFHSEATETTYSVMSQSYQLLDQILRDHLKDSTDEMFIEAVHCLAAYAKSPLSVSISLSAINHLSIRVSSLLEDRFDENMVFEDDCDLHVKLWFPLLMALSSCTGDARESVRSSATDALFEVLRQFGNKFSPGFWKLVVRGILVPIFDDIRHLPGGNDEQERSHIEVDHNKQWAVSTGTMALNNLIDLFVRYMQSTKHLLWELLKLLESWINQESENLAREGVSALSRLSRKGGESFSEEEWITLTSFLETLVQSTLPHELFDNLELLNEMEQLHSNGIDSERVKANTSVPSNLITETERTSSNVDVSGGSRLDEMTESPGSFQTVPTQKSAKDKEDNENEVVVFVEDDEWPGPMCFYEYHPEETSQRDRAQEELISQATKFSTEKGSSSKSGNQHSSSNTTNAFHHTANFKVVRCKSVVQLLLSQLILETVEEHFHRIPDVAIEKMISSMETSISFARSFNSNYQLRFALWKSGFMNQIPNLLKQEMNGTMNLLQVLGWILSNDNSGNKRSSEFIEKLELHRIHLCQQILKEYSTLLERSLESSPKKTEEQRELQAASSVVVSVLHQLIAMSDFQFQKTLQESYDCLMNLVRSESPQVRDAVAKLLQEKVRLMFHS